MKNPSFEVYRVPEAEAMNDWQRFRCGADGRFFDGSARVACRAERRSE